MIPRTVMWPYCDDTTLCVVFIVLVVLQRHSDDSHIYLAVYALCVQTVLEHYLCLVSSLVDNLTRYYGCLDRLDVLCSLQCALVNDDYAQDAEECV